MRLDDYIEMEVNERAERRRLAMEKSYAIVDHLEDFRHRFDDAVQGDSLFGSVSPSIFVGRSNYPNVATGILSPVGYEAEAGKFETSAAWYDEGVSIDDVFERRTSLLNSNRPVDVKAGARGGDALDVHDAWNGFLGVQREVAIADRPVGVEIGLDGAPELDFDVTRDDVATPTGPRARARSADLAENPHVPRPVKKTLEDDDWQAQGAMNYLYRRGFDVYDITRILSAGALGRGRNRRLVPTRWSITAVDDTVGGFLRGTVRDAPGVDAVEVWRNEYLGNAFWVVLAPGRWEFELVEMKAPGSIWNPDPQAGMWLASDREGFEGRTRYVEETAGAYYASRLAVLEHLHERGRQAKCLVIRHVSDDYWGPVGVWQVREAVRHAFEGERGEAETFGEAIREVANHLPVGMDALRRKSGMVAGLQTSLADFAGNDG
ncbi:DNA repair protein NreA [Halegenticoccus tardaugens]|uniref:DNA repair protein NreA n=1 Tax=Halegenticoccus tardaugens TaxID=2071624 RepID=UPI00100A7BC9|nr:DNA repair protein NreA [Halegenticoccus tardaugens]